MADSELATRSGFAVDRMHRLEETTHQSGSERRKLEMLGGTPVCERRLRVLTLRKRTHQAATTTSPNVVASSGGVLASSVEGR